MTSIENPFNNWLESQQTTGMFARDKDYIPVSANDPEACVWCAEGWLMHKDFKSALILKFDKFLADKYDLIGRGCALVRANDYGNWKPERFKEEWDEFMKKEKSE